MNRHINAIVNYLVFSLALGVLAGILARVSQTYNQWNAGNVMWFIILTVGCLCLLLLALSEIRFALQAKRKYGKVL